MTKHEIVYGLKVFYCREVIRGAVVRTSSYVTEDPATGELMMEESAAKEILRGITAYKGLK